MLLASVRDVRLSAGRPLPVQSEENLVDVTALSGDDHIPHGTTQHDQLTVHPPDLRQPR